VLEATAFRLDRLVSGAVTATPQRIVSTGGGARSDVWTRIKASVLGCTFVTVEPEEPAAYGAAYFAGRAAGLVEDCGGGIPESWVAVRSTVDPDPALRRFYLSQHHRYEVS
jgi:xylulokinase